LNDREFKRAIAVLCGVTLKSMFIRSANPGHFHFDQNAAGSGLWQRIFSYFVMTRFYECRCEYALGRHIR
jgi:hypothetical protein